MGDGEKDETFGFIMQPVKAFIHISRCTDQPEKETGFSVLCQ